MVEAVGDSRGRVGGIIAQFCRPLNRFFDDKRRIERQRAAANNRNERDKRGNRNRNDESLCLVWGTLAMVYVFLS